MRRFSHSVAVLALLFSSQVQAQTPRPRFVNPLPSAQVVFPDDRLHPFTPNDFARPSLKRQMTGLLTTQLSDKDRVRWKAIEQLVWANAKTGEPLHPILRDLWRWADTSGHIIQVELIDAKAIQSSLAGSFHIERFDPTGRCHVTSLKLYLSNIDQAVVGPQVARANGFIPFTGLRKEDRYAEVLGHELAHVKYVLNNAMRAWMVHELVEATNEILLLRARTTPAALSSPEMKQRLNQRDELLRELEAQAETIEEGVWHELTNSRKARTTLQAMSGESKSKNIGDRKN